MLQIRLSRATKLVPWCKKRESSHWSSANVRKTFLDYFADESHLIVPSNSVIPAKWRNVQPLPFVNAGMVSWRPIFMDEVKAPKRFEQGVANSQKCIRVGGKNCDLQQIGHDGHHLSYFEMLGNWAFDDSYGREKSIKQAWNLLTNVYNLPPERLFVTYFGGCEKLGLLPDHDTKEIWRSMGVDPNRILPFGEADNFWRMGLDGPCGPCTEIHYSFVDGIDAKKLVNSESDNSVIEIWNLVFMEHFQKLTGELSPLPRNHVDTGMGLERLTAVLSGSRSNYDTDLFVPLFEVISQWTGKKSYSGSFHSDLDTNYRILADHIRMVTVCLADQLLPDASPKMRQVLRRALRIQRDQFGIEDPATIAEMTFDLTECVLDTLSFHYPSPDLKKDLISSVLHFEVENMVEQDAQNNKAMNKLVTLKGAGVKDKIDPSDARLSLELFKLLDRSADNIQDGVISSELAFKAYDGVGIKGDALDNCLSAYGVQLDKEAFAKRLEEAKKMSKQSSLISNLLDNVKVGKTDDSYKHQYHNSNQKKDETKYIFPSVQAQVVHVSTLENGKLGVLLNKTCCYGEAGGQIGDSGKISSIDGQKLMTVTNTQTSPDGNHIWHIGFLEANRTLEPGTRVKVNFDINKRIELMQNHTATHMLNCVLLQLFPFTQQKSSLVHEKGLKFDFISLEAPMDIDTVTTIEVRVGNYIGQNAKVERIVLSNPQATFEDDQSLQDMLKTQFPKKLVITLPDESYPSQVSIIKLPDSVEPCCGTHVNSTGDVQDFVITSVKSTHPGQKSLRCITGPRAVKARESGIQMIDDAIVLSEQLEVVTSGEAEQLEFIQKGIRSLQKKIHEKREELPFTVKQELSPMLDEMKSHVNAMFGGESIEDILNADEEIVVGKLNKPTNIKRINKNLSTKPYFVVYPDAKQPGQYVTLCNVPKISVAEDSDFNSEMWLKYAFQDQPDLKLKTFKKQACYTQSLPIKDVDAILADALLFAQEYIK